MTIKVNRFMVRYNGKIYGPGKEAGQVIEGLSEEEEAYLIANSNGTIEKFEPYKVKPQSEDIKSEAPEKTSTEHEPDLDVVGKDPENITVDDLIKLGEEKKDAAPFVGVKELEALRTILKPLTKNQLMIYAKQAEVDVPDKSKNEEIIQIIINAAELDGINLDAMNSDQLVEFALAIEVGNVKPDMNKEELLKAIEAHYEEIARNA